ncbi:MAG: hypothetical protein R2880_09715 [Deinococcales bacterium]
MSHLLDQRKRSGAGFVASWLIGDQDGDRDLMSSTITLLVNGKRMFYG